MTRFDSFLFAPVEARTAAIFRLLLALLVALVFWEDRDLLARIAQRPELAGLWESLFRTPAWWAATLLALLAFAAGVGGRAGGLVPGAPADPRALRARLSEPPPPSTRSTPWARPPSTISRATCWSDSPASCPTSTSTSPTASCTWAPSHSRPGSAPWQTVAVESALAVGFSIPRLRRATAALGLAFHLSLQWVVTIG